MSYNATLRAAIAAAIHTPADPPITGAALQSKLLAIVDGIDAGAVFLGVVTPASIPTTEANCFFLAVQPGTYANFTDTGGTAIALAAGEVALIRSTIINDSLRWQKLTIVDGLQLVPIKTSPVINPDTEEGTVYKSIVNAVVGNDIKDYYAESSTMQILRVVYYLSGWWKISNIYTIASWTDANGFILKIESLQGNDNDGLTLDNTPIVAPAGAKYLYLLSRIKNFLTNPIIRVEKEDVQRRKARMLVIGNSYSQDALGYMPFLLPKVTDNIDLTVGILYAGGGSLSDHWTNWSNDSALYDLYISQSGNPWEKKVGKTIRNALDEYHWDMIVTQQKSSDAYDFSTYQPYLNNLLSAIQNYIDYPVKFGWMLIQSRPGQTSEHYPNFPENTIVANYESIATNADKVLDETLCEFVLPWGTAIQNARSINSIALLGDYAESSYNNSGKGYLTFDGVHLQEGLPCEIAAYTCLLVLLSLTGDDYHSVLGDDTTPNSAWLQGKNIPGANGQPVGDNLDKVRIAQKCAVMAIKKPFEVTEMTGLVPADLVP